MFLNTSPSAAKAYLYRLFYTILTSLFLSTNLFPCFFGFFGAVILGKLAGTQPWCTLKFALRLVCVSVIPRLLIDVCMQWYEMVSDFQ